MMTAAGQSFLGDRYHELLQQTVSDTVLFEVVSDVHVGMKIPLVDRYIRNVL
jgi:hypothetical protein